MTRDDIIRMARKAYGTATWLPDELERFAALVAAAERNRTWTQDHWTEYERSIAAAEREACADVCEGHYDTAQAAKAIRARSEHGQ